MKHLFNEHEAYNDDGNKFSILAQEAIEKLIRDGEKEGYCIRDMEMILTDNVTATGAISRLYKAMRNRDRKTPEMRFLYDGEEKNCTNCGKGVNVECYECATTPKTYGKWVTIPRKDLTNG